ncbi:filamentous hemagglutinin family N-terminal domain-containing protein [Sphingomonas sp. NFR04]|uniref:hypothetical protein n=1 Tax=Sphingomonas sp. NFR04 TaxID=1566283 RepID=UPI0008F2D840|nr:hypothetical protein [Sphingomonas sp. NFR04]SFK24147.1 filamentous hemagglutinin family N-terminal domain-containing protein [Sphingomonas sp. NFR04]
MVGSVRNDIGSFIATVGATREKQAATPGFRIPEDAKVIPLSTLKATTPPQSIVDAMATFGKLDEQARAFTGIADNDVSKVWGNIEVDGRVVAQIYQNGIVASETKYQLPDPDIQDPAGRAASIIKAYGGKLVLRKDIKNLVQFLG